MKLTDNNNYRFLAVLLFSFLLFPLLGLFVCVCWVAHIHGDDC